jgi:hypothetical protein
VSLRPRVDCFQQCGRQLDADEVDCGDLDRATDLFRLRFNFSACLKPAGASGDGMEWLVSSGSRPSKCGRPQANRVTLTKFCRCNNSSGDDLAHHVRLAGVVKRFEGSFKSFTHHRNRLRVERSRAYK